MPIFITHDSPATTGPVAAQVGDSRFSYENAQLQQVQREAALRQQQFQLQLRQRQEEQAAQQRQQDIDNNFRQQQFGEGVRQHDQLAGYHEQQIGLGQQRIVSQADQAAAKLGIQQELAGLKESEKWRRLSEHYRLRGDLQSAKLAWENADREDRQTFTAGQNENLWNRQDERANTQHEDRLKSIEATNERSAKHLDFLRSQTVTPKDPVWQTHLDMLTKRASQSYQAFVTAKRDRFAKPENLAAAGIEASNASMELEAFLRDNPPPKPQSKYPQPPQAPVAPGQQLQTEGLPNEPDPLSQINPADIDYTARKHGLTPQEVMAKLGLA